MTLLLRVSIGLLLAIIWGSGFAQEEQIRPRFRWIDRPWEYRYLFQVKQMYIQKHLAESSAKDIQKGDVSRDVFGYFDPTLALTVPVNSANSDDTFAITRIDVAKDRTVTTPNTAGLTLTARLNDIEYIVFTHSAEHPEFTIHFGKFFMGTFAAADPRYSPTICSGLFGDSLSPNDSGRYVVGSKPGSDGYFGCREWAAQLYDSNRPYIDVTSYEMSEDYSQDKIKKGKRKGKYPLIPATYVRPFIGFSRYQDPPKPVIGNHKGTWACFNDCPDDDAPGIIPDIQAWVARHHWPMPTKPKNVREFMDKTPDQIDLDE